MSEMTTENRSQCLPSEFTWIADQNPSLSNGRWRDVSAEAGAIVANDILDRVRVHIFDSSQGEWNVHVVVDGYTDGEGDEIKPTPVGDLLEMVRYWKDDGAVKGLVELLRFHADRLEKEMKERADERIKLRTGERLHPNGAARHR